MEKTFMGKPFTDQFDGGRHIPNQRRYDMRHEMLTQRARFCIGVMAKKGTLSQHFVTHVVPPLIPNIANKLGCAGIPSLN